MFMFNARNAATSRTNPYIADKTLFCAIAVKHCIGCVLVFGAMKSVTLLRYTGNRYLMGGDYMRKFDEIVFWACILVIAILAFLGGMLTFYGILMFIWRF